MPLTFGVAVVMPLAAVVPPLGSVKSTVPPTALRVMPPRLRSTWFEVLSDSTTAEAPGLIVRPLNCWLLFVLALPWIASVPPPKTKVEALLALLMMLAVGTHRLGEIEQEFAGGDRRVARVGVAAAECQDPAAGRDQTARSR